MGGDDIVRIGNIQLFQPANTSAKDDMSKYGFITPILLKSGLNPTVGLLRILRSLIPENLWVLEVSAETSLCNAVGKNYLPGYHKVTRHVPGRNGMTRVLNYIRTESRVAINIALLSTEVKIWVFYGEHSPLPMITARLLGKTIILDPVANPVKILEKVASRYRYVGYAMSRINFMLSHRIVLYSPRLIDEWSLEKHRHKVRIAHEHFFDFNNFTVTTPLINRPPLIGYIGRLSEEKGIWNFTQALPIILGRQKDLRVLIGGDGQLKEAIETSLQDNGSSVRVDLTGWISHDDLPGYLNQLRLLVLPSHTEGLPTIILEAMACGTPVLTTAVGAIPDVIVDGETGFVMENNSPECIAANVARVLCSPELEQIAENGRRFVEENFTFEKAGENWRRILADVR